MKKFDISGRLFLAVGRVVLCITLLASTHSRLTAQDREPLKLSVLDDYAAYNIVTSATAPQSDFVLGWNWGDSPSRDISKAMNINLWHGDGGKSSSWDFVRLKATENMKMVWALNHGLDPTISGDINQRCALQGQAVHLDPTITISTTGIFSLPPGNTEAGAFGFTNKGPGSTEQVNGTFHYVVHTTDIPSPATTALVLSRP